MNSTSNVTLIIPTYNSAATVEETLQSIQEQGEDLQLIRNVLITDDGSSDDTLERVQRCWRVATPLVVARAPRNRGEYVNVNEAVASLGPDIEWYCMMHSDNMAKPGWLAALVGQIKLAPADVGSVCTSYDNLFLDGRTVPGENAPPDEVRTIPGRPESVYGTIRQDCWWHNSTAVVRVEAFRRIGGMPAGQGLRQKGDWDFSLRLLADGWAIQYIPRSLMIYRENAVSVSSANFVYHRDITEAVRIIQRYCAGCPWRILVTVHARYFWALVRRSARSLLRRSWRRFFYAFRAMYIVLQGSVVSLVKSLRRPVGKLGTA